MHGVLLTGHGGYEKLEYREDLPVPATRPGEVLVQVGGAAVNYTDINTRTGWYDQQNGPGTSWAGESIRFPRIQGIDVCGYIARVGEGVGGERVGQRILVEPCFRSGDWKASYLGSECDGGFAQFVAVPSRFAHRIESDLSSVELASFPCSYSTAENLLDRAGVRKGETVLISGASGGVGGAAVQLAKARRAQVIAVCRAQKVDSVRELGADEVIIRDQSMEASIGKDSVDVAIDVAAGPFFSAALRALRPGGRYAVSGAVAGPRVELDLRKLYLKDLTLHGCTFLPEGVFVNLVRRIEKGEVRPVVARTYPLSRIVDAQREFLSDSYTGKLVLIPPQPEAIC